MSVQNTGTQEAQKTDSSTTSIETGHEVTTETNKLIKQLPVNTPSIVSKEPAEEMSTYFDGLIDLVDNDGTVAYLIKDDESLVIDTMYMNGESLLVPPPQRNIPFLLPRGEEVLKHYANDLKLGDCQADAALFDDLVTYHKSISELPGDAYYTLLATWDMHTYLQESLQYSPMICMFAEAERGKSRTGKGMIHVAYRGIHVETLREPHLIRFANDLHVTLFIDAMDLWKKVTRSNSEDIMLQRFEKGAHAFRVLGGSRGTVTDMKRFEIFGPTIIGTNEELHQILDTRAVHITMLPSQKNFVTDVTKENGLSLKERLVSFRARHYLAQLPSVEKPASGRLGDILLPLRKIIKLVRPEKEAQFMDLVQEIQRRKATERTISLEAMIVSVVASLRQNATARHGVLAVRAITDQVNRAWDSSGGNLTTQKIGRALKSLGFHSARMPNGNAGILYNQALINRLSAIYLPQAA